MRSVTLNNSFKISTIFFLKRDNWGAVETYVIMDVYELGSEVGDWIETAKAIEECWMLMSAVMSIVSASRKATKRSQILYFVGHESRCYLCNKNQLDALFVLSLYRQSNSNVSGIFVAHHQVVYCIYTTNGTCYIYFLMTGYKYAQNR